MDPRQLILSDYLQCNWDTAPLLLFSDNVFSPLIYYSHLVPAIAGLLLAFMIWRQKQPLLLNNIFIFLALAFSSWALIDLSLWAHESADYIMFAWSLLVYIEPFIYLGAAYLLYVFATGKDAPLWGKVVGVLLVFPAIILAPTALNLTAFSYLDCEREAVEGPLWHYLYIVEVIVIAWMGMFLVGKLISKKTSVSRAQLFLLGVGLILFLTAFSWGNIVGSFSEDWALGQYGLFGMPIFLGAIIYLIVRFQTFRIRVLGVTAMVATLLVLLFSLLFLQTIESARPVIIVTLVLFALIGYLLIKSVRQEIEQRQRLEQLTVQLEAANDRLKELDQMKSEFLSIASHQLRAPITAVRGYASNINEGEYGPVPEHLKEPLGTVQESARLMAQSIEDYLNISRIEQGRMKYEKSQADISKLIHSVVTELTPVAEKRKLTLSAHIPEGVMVNVDIGKIKQVFTNLVDNAIKYTKQGGVSLAVENGGDKLKVVISDTGIGISAEELPHLFEKFKRARGANKVNTTGTGLGLYVAKQLVEGHGGTLRVESDGEGKGSRFIIELPIK